MSGSRARISPPPPASGSPRATIRPRKLKASAWGWIAVVATALSAVGYALQTILDWVPEPALIGESVFWGLFAGDGVVALLVGLVAMVQGWSRPDDTIRFGLLGVGWFVLAQSIQIIWD